MNIDFYILGTLLAVISYFLKDVYKSFQKLERRHEEMNEKVIKLESKVERLTEKLPDDIEKLEKLLENQLIYFDRQIEEIKRAVRHSEASIKTVSTAFVEIIDRIEKNK
jgi:predicted transcriptional regulator